LVFLNKFLLPSDSPKKLVDSEPIPLPAPSEEEQEE